MREQASCNWLWAHKAGMIVAMRRRSRRPGGSSCPSVSMSSCMRTAPHTRKNGASTRTVVRSCIAVGELCNQAFASTALVGDPIEEDEALNQEGSCPADVLRFGHPTNNAVNAFRRESLRPLRLPWIGPGKWIPWKINPVCQGVPRRQGWQGRTTHRLARENKNMARRKGFWMYSCKAGKTQHKDKRRTPPTWQRERQALIPSGIIRWHHSDVAKLNTKYKQQLQPKHAKYFF